MYIPSLDMGEYDDYTSRSSSRRPPAPSNQEKERNARTIERQPSKKKLENYPRLPR